tara:strand:+ start:806 stop:1390 length:585 start_codon:yes stop_codon:yes gene_type:complete
MIIIGLTGSIGMGKTTTAAMFEKHGVPTISADDIVHKLYENEAVSLIENLLPGTTKNGVVDRLALSAELMKDPSAFKKLNALIHPLVRQKQDEFISVHKSKNTELVLLDIPLLFETGAEARVDTIIVVSCDAAIQKKRVLARPNMSVEKFELIVSKQMPDAQKRALADHIVDTSHDLEHSEAQVVAIIELLRHS